MRVGYTILFYAEESGIDENWFLLNNQSTCNYFIDGKYLSIIIYSTDVKYLRVHYNEGVTYTNKIGVLPVYQNKVWCNTKGIENTLSLVLVQKHHTVKYNSQYENYFFVHIPQ